MRATIGTAILAAFVIAGCRTGEVETGAPSPGEGAQPAGLSADLVPAGTQLVVELNQTLDTENTEVGDAFTATVTNDLRAGATTVVPSGAVVHGVVTGLDDSDHVGDQAAIRLNFERIEFNGQSHDFSADVTDADVDVEGRDIDEIAERAGIGAAAGAILGAIIGGDLEDILVGGALGAGAGTIISLGIGDAEAALPRGSDLTLRTTSDVRLRCRGRVRPPAPSSGRRPHALQSARRWRRAARGGIDSGVNRTDPKRAVLQLTPGGVAATLAVLVVAAVCVRLGFWQLDRLQQRRERNAALAERLQIAPIAFVNAAGADTAGLTFRRTHARGTFDDDRTIVLPGRSFQGLPGVHVVTPLRLAELSSALLVNRGWLPAADAATIEFEAIRTHGDTTIEGILLPFPGRGESLAPPSVIEGDSAFRRVWFAIDEPAMRAQFPYPLHDVMLQLVPRADGVRAPRPLPPPSLDEGPHLGYALQWFSFATIAVVGWLVLVLRRERGGRERD